MRLAQKVSKFRARAPERMSHYCKAIKINTRQKQVVWFTSESFRLLPPTVSFKDTLCDFMSQFDALCAGSFSGRDLTFFVVDRGPPQYVQIH